MEKNAAMGCLMEHFIVFNHNEPRGRLCHVASQLRHTYVSSALGVHRTLIHIRMTYQFTE